MKKWLALFAVLIVALLAWIYFYIPPVITVKASAVIPATRPGLHRLLLNNHKTSEWWQGGTIDEAGKNSLRSGNRTYTFSNNNISLLPVIISSKTLNLQTELYLIAVTDTTVQTEWISSIAASENPIHRVQAFFASGSIQQDMKRILQSLSSYCTSTKNIYGFEVNNMFITDSSFIAISDTGKIYPTTGFIYKLIDRLKIYADQHDAQMTNYPILNIDPVDADGYAVKVAIPVNKVLSPSGRIYPQRMPVNVKILMAEVQGGALTATAAYRQLIQYAYDRHLAIPGKPFYSLVTERRNEPDTSKWVTRIYCPVR